MKLSSRKELLKESELTLKSIKKSLNEAATDELIVLKSFISTLVDLNQALYRTGRRPPFSIHVIDYTDAFPGEESKRIENEKPKNKKKYMEKLDRLIKTLENLTYFKYYESERKNAVAELKKYRSEMK
jgi:hypothetical protein